jgi:hypothetical protein
MRPDSDLDLFVVRPNDVDAEDEGWREQLDTLSRDVTNWTGNDARVLEYSAKEVQRGLRGRDAVPADIGAEGLRLAGPDRYLQLASRRGT